MSRTVFIDNVELEVEITSVVDVAGDHGTWDSDWDYHGYREMEYDVLSGRTELEDGDYEEMSKEVLADFSGHYSDQIEQCLWDQLEDEGGENDPD